MKKNRSLTKGAFQLIRPNAAGIDVGSESHYVAVPEDRDPKWIRCFGSFTQDLYALAKWLKQCKIDTVAMESTGVYWIQLYLILEEQGFDVFLVNARHVKNVSGRKTDVKDCQWIQQLHSYGLLNASFQPDLQGRELRTYIRHRKNLTQNYAMQIQLMQKAFEQMNIKLQNVLTDITGKTGISIIEAILQGERNAAVLAEFADPRVKASKEDIIKSLQANWRREHLFELQQAYDLYLFYREKIRECDKQIEMVLQQSSGSANDDNPGKGAKRWKNSFDFNATFHLKNLLGVDITEIFGISEVTAMQIVAETGIDMTKWPTKKHFVSWLNLSPNNRISGGKILKPKREKRKNHAGQAFLIAATTVQRSDHWLGIFFRRIAAKHGPGIAIKATARKLALIFYQMIKNQESFDPMPIEAYNQNFKERKLKYIKSQASMLGFQLVPS